MLLERSETQALSRAPPLHEILYKIGQKYARFQAYFFRLRETKQTKAK
jgi:hypothetical protein